MSILRIVTPSVSIRVPLRQAVRMHHKKGVEHATAPKKKAAVKPKPIQTSTILPKGTMMQGEERVMMTQTTMVDGKPVTKTLMKARKYYTDPKTGRVIEETIDQAPKKVAGGQKVKEAADGEASTKAVESAQKSFAEANQRFHNEMMQMEHDLRNLWRFPFC